MIYSGGRQAGAGAGEEKVYVLSRPAVGCSAAWLWWWWWWWWWGRQNHLLATLLRPTVALWHCGTGPTPPTPDNRSPGAGAADMGVEAFRAKECMVSNM